MRDTECAVLEDLGAEKGGKRSRNQVGFGLGIWFGEGLEGFVGSKSIT